MSKPLERQDWLEPDALDRFEQESDPLSVIFEKSRARRMGADYVPDPLPKLVTPASGTVRPPASLPVALVQSPLSPAFVAGANRELSGLAFKVLMAIVVMGDGCYTTTQLGSATRTHRQTILKGVGECLDYGWLERRALCSLCETEGETEEDGRQIACPKCRRNAPVKHAYRVLCPLEGVGANNTNLGVDDITHAVFHITPLMSMTSSPGANSTNPAVDDIRVEGEEASVTGLKRRAVRIAAEMAAVPGANHPTPLRSIAPTPDVNRSNPDVNRSNPGVNRSNPGVINTTPRACVDSDSDSDSDSNITNDSDSEYMRNGTRNGTGTGKSEVEQLAQASCKALETGTASLGMHIKAWAHARQLDAKTGGKAHQTALQAIQRELAAQRKETGQVQGKAWTRRVVDYFEGQGVPLMTSRKS